MDCSVVICSWNRADQIVELLSSFTHLIIPAGTVWEIIVVNNGSTDSTAEVISSFEKKLPLKVIFQPIPGISNARNMGLAAATGKYILWTDDDVKVAPGWISAYLAAFRNFPDAVIFGGNIIPVLVPPTPDWFRDATEALSELLCKREFSTGTMPVPIGNSQVPFGANFAVRANEQKQFRYNPNLGVAPGRRRGGEEIAVIRTILNAGHTGWWIPGADVKHMIPKARQTLEYIFYYYEKAGELWAYAIRNNMSAVLFGASYRISVFLFGVPVIIWFKASIFFARYYIARTFKLKPWVKYATKWAWYRGAILYFLSIHKAD